MGFQYTQRSRFQLIAGLSQYDIERAIEDDTQLSNVVNKIMSADPRDASRFIGRTSVTAYRRVHEIIASTFDRFMSSSDSVQTQRFSRGLLRGLILIRYQLARDQISKSLADTMRVILDKLRRMIGDSDLPESVERARILIDSLAVLVYQFGR